MRQVVRDIEVELEQELNRDIEATMVKAIKAMYKTTYPTQ